MPLPPTSRVRISATLVLLVLPCVTFAQGGIGGFGGLGRPGGVSGRRGAGDGMRRGGEHAMPTMPTAQAFEQLNAAEALLQDSAALKLTNDQIARFIALRTRLTGLNSDLSVRYDSTYRHLQASLPMSNDSGQKPVERGDREEQFRDVQTMTAIAEEMLERRPQYVAECLAVVDAAQHNRAKKTLDKQTDELKKLVPKRDEPRRERFSRE